MAGMARRLKVYRTNAGFYETIVAAPNQGEALKAWGVRQNLFAEGAAEVVTDAVVVAAAMDAPGQPLRRPIGSLDAFKLDPAVPKAPKGGKAQARPKPDRRALDAAEAELDAVEQRRAAQVAEFEERQAALDADRDKAAAAWRTDHKTVVEAVKKAKRAYEKAGGERGQGR